MNNTGDAIGALIAALTVVATAGWLAFKVGPALTAPPTKSERQLCEERGGVYGAFRDGRYHCFAKEAFR